MDIEEDLKKISERFNNGTETMNDIINYCRNYKITFENGTEINVIEKKYFDKLVEKIKELEVLEDDLKDKRIVYVDTPEFEEKFIAKQKVKEELEKAEKENVPYEEYNKESRAYWINQGKISLAKKILEDK